MNNPRQAHLDYTPVPFRNVHGLEPGMPVRPMSPDGKVLDERRWKVERVSGAFTRCIANGAEGSDKQFTSQYWATDSLQPIVAPPKDGTNSAQVPAVKGSKAPDDLAVALKNCHGLDELLAYAASLGYPHCDTLRAKVSHLNPGLQRMNVGNRLRRHLGLA